MKKVIAGLLFVFTTLVLSGCTASDMQEAKQADEQKSTQKVPTQQEQKRDKEPAKAESQSLELNPTIFDKKKKNQELSKAELKQDIQTYLDAYHDITRIYEHYQDKLYSKEGISKSDAKHIEHASALASKNDNNFAQHINENRLPKGYGSYAHKINRYIMNSNQYLRDIDEQIDTAMATSKNERVSVKEVGEIENADDQSNKREQKKIEKILEDENIETRAFK